MKLHKQKLSQLAAGVACVMGLNAPASADALIEALQAGKVTGAARLRFESVEQDNALDDAEALTLRSRLTYTSGAVNGFNVVAEVEDSRIVGGYDEYAPTSAGYSVIADPETTEIDQAFLQYKNDMLTTKIGRQVITLDNHRFVGHVGWRQDKQTFDAARLMISPMENLNVDASILVKRNRIFAETADQNSEDILLNVSYAFPFGKLTGYSYMLDNTDVDDDNLDTMGVRFAGKSKLSESMSLSYTAEMASQSNDTNDADTEYMLGEIGFGFSGVMLTAGLEVLGSDDNNGSFQTPLATLHKFNGWADQFIVGGTPAQGLEDMYLSVGTKVAGVKVVAAYHDYSANEAAGGVDDLGDEINVLVAKKFNDNYSAGLKYASYSAGDQAAGKVDTDKIWLWTEMTF